MLSPETQKKLALTISVIPCPNCGGKFYPKANTINITNICCSSCSFEALFNTIEGEETEVTFSIEKDDAERLMQEKRQLPPVIMHWVWQQAGIGMRIEMATLYPFIPYTFLRVPEIVISLSEQVDNTVLFLRVNEELPSLRIYRSPADDSEIAEVVSTWDNRSTSHIQRTLNFGYSRAARIVDMVNEIRRKKGLDTESVQDIEDDEDEE